MRTAEYYLENANGFFYLEDYVFHKQSVIKAINEARKECLEEAANKVMLKQEKTIYQGYDVETYTINKQSILLLIDELK